MATVLLITVLLLLVRVANNVERVWQATSGLSDVHSSARVVFDVVAQDLRSVVAEGGVSADRDIRFHQESDAQLWFVAVNAFGAGDAAVVEVAYDVQDHELTRSYRDDTFEEWNIYGTRSSLSSYTGRDVVADGVIDQQITCYDSDGTRWSVPTPATVETGLPASISVTLTLLDDDSFLIWSALPESRRDAYAAARSRTLTRRFFLGDSF